MIKLINKFINRFPKLSQTIEQGRTTLWQDICLCVAVTLACGFYSLELYRLAVLADTVRNTLMVLLVVCWLWIALKNGFRERYGFMLFIAVYWIAPRIVIVKASQNTSIRTYSKLQDISAQLCELFVEHPLKCFAERSEMNVALVTILLVGGCVIAFWIGYAVKCLLNRDKAE